MEKVAAIAKVLIEQRSTTIGNLYVHCRLATMLRIASIENTVGYNATQWRNFKLWAPRKAMCEGPLPYLGRAMAA